MTQMAFHGIINIHTNLIFHIINVLYLDVMCATYAFFVVMYAWLDVCGNDFIEWFHHYGYLCQDVISPFTAYPFPRDSQPSTSAEWKWQKMTSGKWKWQKNDICRMKMTKAWQKNDNFAGGKNCIFLEALSFFCRFSVIFQWIFDIFQLFT